MSLPHHLPFVGVLQQQGARVYMVGGTLRDRLLGKEHKDYDLLVTGLPYKTLVGILRQHGRVQLMGRTFGIIKFLPSHWDASPIDIALPRKEVSTGVGHRDFEVAFDHTLPIAVDLERRDFTINAMALDLADDRLIDPFGGHRDLQQRILRQVSPQAFPEDPLRMLRGVQFAARFALQVEALTYQAMRLHASSISTVAAERIAEEFRKLLQAPAPSCGFYLMQEVDLLAPLLPEVAGLVAYHDPTAAALPDLANTLFARTMRRLDAVQQQTMLLRHGQPDLLLAALWCDCGQSVNTLDNTPVLRAQRAAELAWQRLETLRMTMIGAHPALIATLITHSAFSLEALASAAALRHFAHRVGCQEALMVFDLRLADVLGNPSSLTAADLLYLRQRLQAEIALQVPLQLRDLAVNGRDLQQLGIAAGPRLGDILQHLLQHVLDDPGRNTRSYLLAIAQQAFRAAEQQCPTM